ncbi:MAG: Zn-dependent protease [Myxococcota bacterium]|jgi:Zn-dependent protease
MDLFKVQGIPLRLHISFVALAAILISIEAITGGLGAAAAMATLGAGLFGSVLLHELGHALVARRFGIDTRSITLYPFGGIAALTAEPDSPRSELWIALAGPAVNFALAALTLPLAWLGAPLAATFIGINLVLGIFNLLPAFPMDGGRVLRAALSPRLGRLDATEQALNISRGFAWVFITLGLLASPNLLIVGGFLLLALRAERHRLALQRLAAEQATRARAPIFQHVAS